MKFVIPFLINRKSSHNSHYHTIRAILITIAPQPVPVLISPKHGLSLHGREFNYANPLWAVLQILIRDVTCVIITQMIPGNVL